MEYYYIAMLVFLAGLACFDLFVGVSNDAVNFLNSAMGSRIASFRTTMWVATFGVLLGATFSSGMMEVARSGIFHPQMFNFTEVMIIFFAVMIADIVLLDTFNSLGLPTSTTVSIVFELLGSAIAAAAIKLYWEGGSLQMVFDYINTSESLTIISAILISVVVAFISGAVVQYIMRLIFSFYFERVYPYVGGVFGGLSITAIAYFLVMKELAVPASCNRNGLNGLKPILKYLSSHYLSVSPFSSTAHPCLQIQCFQNCHLGRYLLPGFCLRW